MPVRGGSTVGAPPVIPRVAEQTLMHFGVHWVSTWGRAADSPLQHRTAARYLVRAMQEVATPFEV